MLKSVRGTADTAAFPVLTTRRAAVSRTGISHLFCSAVNYTVMEPFFIICTALCVPPLNTDPAKKKHSARKSGLLLFHGDSLSMKSVKQHIFIFLFTQTPLNITTFIKYTRMTLNSVTRVKCCICLSKLERIILYKHMVMSVIIRRWNGLWHVTQWDEKRCYSLFCGKRCVFSFNSDSLNCKSL